MGRGQKKQRTLARDFKQPRADVWRPGTGSAAPHRKAAGTAGVGNAGTDGSWDMPAESLNNDQFVAFYQAREQRRGCYEEA